jgi:hypothetical protein
MMADIHVRRGNWQEAHRLYEQCLDKLLQNQDNRSLEQTYSQPSVAVYTMRLALATEKLGRKQQGAGLIERGLDLYVQSRKRNQNLASSALHSLEFLKPALTYYSETQQRQKAAELLQSESINLLEAISEKSPGDAGIMYAISDGYAEKGDLLSGYGVEDNSFSVKDKGHLTEARESYEKALRYAEEAAACFDASSGGRQRREAIEQKIRLLSSKLQA